MADFRIGAAVVGGGVVGCAVAWAVFGAGMALFQPAYSALISKAVPERLRGTAFGLFSTSLGIISLPAPWIGAQMWELVEPRAPFFVPLVAVALLLPVVWFKLKLEPSTEQPTGSTEAEKFTDSG